MGDLAPPPVGELLLLLTSPQHYGEDSSKGPALLLWYYFVGERPWGKVMDMEGMGGEDHGVHDVRFSNNLFASSPLLGLTKHLSDDPTQLLHFFCSDLIHARHSPLSGPSTCTILPDLCLVSSLHNSTRSSLKHFLKESLPFKVKISKAPYYPSFDLILFLVLKHLLYTVYTLYFIIIYLPFTEY